MPHHYDERGSYTSYDTVMFNGAGYRRAIENELSIIDKNKKDIPFLLSNGRGLQADAIEKLTNRNVFLKARKLGVSSMFLAIGVLKFLLGTNERCVIMSFDSEAASKQLERAKHFIRSFEKKNNIKIPMKYNSKKELVYERFNEKGEVISVNSLRIGTARSDSFGRGDDISFLHITEVSLCENLSELIAGVGQAVINDAMITLETTANGYNEFYKFWVDSVNGVSGFKPFFYGADWEYDEAFLAQKKLELKDKFPQEYPITWQEAFISMSRPIFNKEALTWYRTISGQIKPPIAVGELIGVSNVSFDKTDAGPLKVWEMPQGGEEYVLGVDCSEGKLEGDFSCIQVLKRRDLSQVAVWHGTIEPDQLAKEAYKLGRFYGMGWLGVERNSIGIATVIVLRDLFYPNLYMKESVDKTADEVKNEFGWRTDAKSKPIMISDMQEIIRNKLIKIRDELTLNELFSYQYDEKGHANAVAGGYDDRVMALMIAYQMYKRCPSARQASNQIVQGSQPDFVAADNYSQENYLGEPTDVNEYF